VKNNTIDELLVPRVTLMDSQSDILSSMHDDIALATKSIYLEIYRFGSDYIGERFRDILAVKCEQGLQVKLLLDSWGTSQSSAFFEPIIRNGGEVLFFKKIKFFVDFFTKNHRRNHRKILVIDDNITYLSSSNITGYSMNWREICLRMEGPVSMVFRKVIIDSSKIYNKYIFNRFAYKKTIYYNGFEIIQDLPSLYRQQVKKRYEKLFSKAKQEIIIETPYFLPGYKLRRQMLQAVRRGVNVIAIMPLHSDVRTVDFLRDKYLKFMYNNGIQLYFYTKNNLHAKCILVDKETFAVGSSNFDYRSFRYQYEIVLLGKQPDITALVNNHLEESLKGCIPFDYNAYLRRPLIEKVFGWAMLPFRHLF